MLLSQHRKNSYASIKVNNKRKKHEERSSDEREWERERMLGYERVSLKYSESNDPGILMKKVPEAKERTF